MSFDGYINFGGVEIINAKRTTEYVKNMAVGLPFVRNTDIYDTLNAVLGNPTYRTPFLDGASWVETDPPSNLEQANPTHNFYGLYPLEILGIGDSTMGATVTEALGDGGYVNTPRDASRPIKIHGILLAGDMLAAEHGLTWLRNALTAGGCGLHDYSCGYSDLRYFLAPPDVCDPQFNTVFSNTEDDSMGSLSPATSPITFFPNTDGSAIKLQWLFDNSDGAIIRYGTQALDGPQILRSLGPIRVRRTNFVPNPTFANDVTNWVTGSATLVRVNDGIDDTYARANQSASPVTYRTNWLPDPSFEHGDPNTLGWRGSDDITQVTDGTAPNGTHVAVVPVDASGNWMEATMLGPYDSGVTGTFSFYNRHNSSVTVQVKDNLGVVIFTHVFSGLTEAWARLSVSGVPMNLNYSIRVSTDGSKELRTDAYLLEAVGSLGTFFSGDSGAGYTFVGGSAANASRFASGTNTSFHVETVNTITPVGPAMATFAMRSEQATPSVLVELVDPVGTVLGSQIVMPTPAWTRFALGVPFGGQAKLRLTSSTGYFDLKQVMLEAGAEVLPYFDGSYPAPEDYTLVWLGGPNASPSRMDWTGTTLLESDTPVRFWLALDQGALQAVTARSWWPERISVDEQMEPYDRTYHNVYCTNGVARIKDYTFDAGAAIEVDFVLTSEVPHAFSTQGETIPFTPGSAVPYSDVRTNLVTNPSGEAATTGYTALPGTGGTAAITNPTVTTPDGTKVIRCTWTVASTAAGGGIYYEVPVTAGLPYVFHVDHIQSSVIQRLQLSVDWYNGASLISNSAAAAVVVAAATPVVGTLAATAPALATKARIKVISVTGTSYANWANTNTLDVDGVLAVYGTHDPGYFDGSTVDANHVWQYAWNGTANASTSYRAHYVAPSNPLIDPDLPVLATPPSAPAIPDIALSPILDWTRYYLDIPAGNVAEWAETIPVLTLLTQTLDVRQVRVRFHPNPFGWADSKVDPTAYCGEFLLSYLPANSSLTVDGVSESASASVAGSASQPASQLLYGTDGAPMTWPDLSCGIGYLMTVDIPPTAAINNLDLGLVVYRKE